MNDSKPWYLSKTVWINVATLAVGIAQLLASQPWLPPQVVAAIGSVVAIVNIYLRSTTDTKLTK